MLLHIRNAKRGRERYVMLSRRLLRALRAYWKRARPTGPYVFPGSGASGVLTRGRTRGARPGGAKGGHHEDRVAAHAAPQLRDHLLERGTDLQTILYTFVQHLLDLQTNQNIKKNRFPPRVVESVRFE